jgi:hypothetical protein
MVKWEWEDSSYYLEKEFNSSAVECLFELNGCKTLSVAKGLSISMR